MKILFIYLISILNLCAALPIPVGFYAQLAPYVAPPAGNLTDGLLVFYNMNETSGNRSDSIGTTNSLSIMYGAGYDTGLIGNAYKGNVNGFLYAVDSPELRFGGGHSWTFSAWMKMHTLYRSALLSKESSVAGEDEIALYNNLIGDQYYFFLTVFSSTDSAVQTYTQNIVATNVNQWAFHLVSWNNSTKDLIWCIADTTNFVYWNTNRILAGLQNPGTGDFRIGRYDTAGNYNQALIDEVAKWNRVLSYSEITNVWKAGTNGTSYPFTGF